MIKKRTLHDVLSEVLGIHEGPVLPTSSSTYEERENQKKTREAKETDFGDDEGSVEQSGSADEVADTDTIIEKINSLRSGKSFKDDNIKNQFDKYVKSLSEDERKALLAFLKGIAQIVTGEVPAKKASDPSDKPSPGLTIKSTDDSSGAVKKIKPVVVKSPTAPIKSKENTKAPVPISAKRKELRFDADVFSQRGRRCRTLVASD